jgi:hypothetical protein
MSKRKQETIIVEEEVKGLPYDKLIKTVLDFVVLGLSVICLLSLVIPVIRTWYPLSNNPTYTNFFIPGYAFIFGAEIQDVGSETSTRILTVQFNLRYFLSYMFVILGSAGVGLGYLEGTKKYKKFFRLISALLFAAAFALVFTYNADLLKELRNYKGISNTIKEIEFTVYGVIHLVSLGLGSIVMFYQANCE